MNSLHSVSPKNNNHTDSDLEIYEARLGGKNLLAKYLF